MFLVYLCVCVFVCGLCVDVGCGVVMLCGDDVLSCCVLYLVGSDVCAVLCVVVY